MSGRPVPILPDCGRLRFCQPKSQLLRYGEGESVQPDVLTADNPFWKVSRDDAAALYGVGVCLLFLNDEESVRRAYLAGNLLTSSLSCAAQ